MPLFREEVPRVDVLFPVAPAVTWIIESVAMSMPPEAPTS